MSPTGSDDLAVGVPVWAVWEDCGLGTLGECPLVWLLWPSRQVFSKMSPEPVQTHTHKK